VVTIRLQLSSSRGAPLREREEERERERERCALTTGTVHQLLHAALSGTVDHAAD
jgi:hypothetical protein